MAFAWEPNASCSEVVRRQAPAHIQLLTETHSWRDGPNCFQAALLWHFPDLEFRRFSPDEFEARMEKYFDPIDPADAGRGDIVVLYGLNDESKGGPLHAMIYAAQENVWHKGGMTKRAPYEYASVEDIFLWGQVKWGELQVRAFRRRPHALSLPPSDTLITIPAPALQW
jgi:hypothetical protein